MENKTKQMQNGLRGDSLSYVYKEGENIELSGNVLIGLIRKLDTIIEKEITTQCKMKFTYVDENGVAKKNISKEDMNSGKYQKIVDWQRTVENPSVEYTLSPEGLELTQLKAYLLNIHMSGIEAGKAVPFEEMMKEVKTKEVQDK